MKEAFLHFLWRTRRFASTDLRTTTGTEVVIENPGWHNVLGGPDFKESRIRIDGVLWAGHVEMHVLSSEWVRHGHDTDPAYSNVVLHVVLEDDDPVFVNGRRIPCIELRGRIDPGMLSRYQRLFQLDRWVPCQPLLPSVPSITIESFMQRLLVERLEQRHESIGRVLHESDSNWESVAYRVLGRSFGFHHNGDAFERLCRTLPYRVVKDHSRDLFDVEALLFGSAGMLNMIFLDAYPRQLQARFHDLNSEYLLKPVSSHEWIRGGLRPSNFPTLRLAQFARLINATGSFIDHLTAKHDLGYLTTWLQVKASEYWRDHSGFDKAMKSKGSCRLGVASARSILINAWIPLMFSYGRHHGDQSLCDRAVELFGKIPRESNRIVNRWHNIGMPNVNAGHSQALIHLKDSYCNRRKCTECAIGTQILLSDIEYEYG